MIKIYVISNNYDYDKMSDLLQMSQHYLFYTQSFKHFELIKQGKLAQTDGTLKDATKDEIINFKRITQKNINQRYQILIKDNMLEFFDSFNQIFESKYILHTFNFISGRLDSAEMICSNLRDFIENIHGMKFDIIEYLKFITAFIKSIQIRVIIDNEVINLNVDSDYMINDDDFNQKNDILYIKRGTNFYPYLSNGGLL